MTDPAIHEDKDLQTAAAAEDVSAALQPVARKSKIAVLVNASAGAIERDGAETLRAILSAEFARHGLTADLEFLPAAQLRAAAQRVLQKAIDGSVDAIVVAGGDGSIRTVAGVLVGHDVALGIIPMGTMNHFARDLGIPAALDQAVAVIAAGHSMLIDTAEVNDQIFINNSSIGIYPFLVLDRERRRRRARLPKWVAMLFAAFRVLRYFPIRRLSIRGAGLSEPHRSSCVFVGNNEYSIAGASLGRRDRLTDGELCVYVARQQSRVALLGLACRLALGLIDESRDLRILKLPAAEIRARRRRKLLVALDGEIEKMRLPLRYRSRPRSLRVLAPVLANSP